MPARKAAKHLIATYVTLKKDGKYAARVVDGRTKKEARCTKDVQKDAISCSREKVLGS